MRVVAAASASEVKSSNACVRNSQPAAVVIYLFIVGVLVYKYLHICSFFGLILYCKVSYKLHRLLFIHGWLGFKAFCFGLFRGPLGLISSQQPQPP